MTSPLDSSPLVPSPLARTADLIAWLTAAGLDELVLDGPDGRVRLRRAGEAPLAPVAPVAAAEPDAGLEVVASPGVGHFLAAHPLRAEPLAAPDEAVVAGQIVALLRVGALLLPVTAPRDGVVAVIVASEGALVGYGDPLLELWPEA